MNKWIKRTLLITVIILLAAAWTWRYVTMNRYYDDLDNSDYQLYQSGEFVPFEDDGLDLETDLNGYHARVDRFEVKSTTDCLSEWGVNVSADKFTAEKIALVYITLKNEDCDPNPVKLTAMLFRGEDCTAPMQYDLLVAANPVLQGYTQIALNPGDECQIVLPYGLVKTFFNTHTWEHIDEETFYLGVTSGLTNKEVQINE